MKTHVEKTRSMREVAVGMGTNETNTKILSNSSMSPAGCSKIKSWSLSLYFYKENIYVFKCFFFGVLAIKISKSSAVGRVIGWDSAIFCVICNTFRNNVFCKRLKSNKERVGLRCP